MGTSWAELRAVVGTLAAIATPVHALELGVKLHAAAVFKIVISHFKQKTTSMAVHYADVLELTCASVVRTAAPFMSLQGKFYACAVSKTILLLRSSAAPTPFGVIKIAVIFVVATASAIARAASKFLARLVCVEYIA